MLRAASHFLAAAGMTTGRFHPASRFPSAPAPGHARWHPPVGRCSRGCSLRGLRSRRMFRDYRTASFGHEWRHWPMRHRRPAVHAACIPADQCCSSPPRRCRRSSGRTESTTSTIGTRMTWPQPPSSSGMTTVMAKAIRSNSCPAHRPREYDPELGYAFSWGVLLAEVRFERAPRHSMRGAMPRCPADRADAGQIAATDQVEQQVVALDEPARPAVLDDGSELPRLHIRSAAARRRRARLRCTSLHGRRPRLGRACCTLRRP